MLYTKPKGVRYTDMAIYIDEHAYREDKTLEEEATIYEYIYHLINMLAHKHNYFKRAEYYEMFAIDLTNRIYYRLINPKQFEYDEEGNPKLDKIKSVLNYIKAVIYGRKVSFEQENYSQVISPKITDDNKYALAYSFDELVNSSSNDLKTVDVQIYLDQISKSVRAFVGKLPYAGDPVMFKNIYLSCLLSINNLITLTRRDAEVINSYKRSADSRLKLLGKYYSEHKDSYIILYHLDSTMYSYIKIILNELKHIIINDIFELSSENITVDNAMKSFIFSELNSTEGEIYE